MRPSYSLESVFGSRSRVRVLRVLCGVSVPLNASQIAARTGLTHPAVTAALAELGRVGIVNSSPAGRATVHWLAKENVLVQRVVEPAFEAEAGILDLILDDLRTEFEAQASSIVLFGSFARGEQDETSDVDVALVAREGESKQELERTVDDVALGFRRKYGSTLSALVYDEAEASQLSSRSPNLQASLEKDGVVVCGPAPAEWAER